MGNKQRKVTVTLDAELYAEIEERSKKEERTKANLCLYLLKKGLESESQK